ncbi:hypothetical protein Tco_1566290, partial [Tanacetum coccineum]
TWEVKRGENDRGVGFMGLGGNETREMYNDLNVGVKVWEFRPLGYLFGNLNSIKDAKLLLEAVENRFGGKAATKKTQRNILKQQYQNFTAPSSEMLDQTFDKLQKLVSQLELLDEKLSQEDVNQKLLRSLSPEWNTHAVVWRNKAELETMGMDDLYYWELYLS